MALFIKKRLFFQWKSTHFWCGGCRILIFWKLFFIQFLYLILIDKNVPENVSFMVQKHFIRLFFEWLQKAMFEGKFQPILLFYSSHRPRKTILNFSFTFFLLIRLFERAYKWKKIFKKFQYWPKMIAYYDTVPLLWNISDLWSR